MRMRSPRVAMALLAVGVTLAGCPHQTDPESTELVGKWEAESLGCLAGKGAKVFNRLDFLDPHRVRLGNGKVVDYVRAEPGELVIDHSGYTGYGYSIYGDELVFGMFDEKSNAVRECRYRLASGTSH